MKRILLGILGVCACHAYAQTFKEWQDPEINAVNRAPMHTDFFAYESTELAAKGMKELSGNFMSLNGNWKFNWVEHADARPEGFWKTDFNDKGWVDFPVPGVWELNGYDVPVYAGVDFGWKGYEGRTFKKPPHVPTENNHVGSYRREVVIPSDWKGKDIIAHFGAVSSNMYLWVNGKFVGYSEDSKMEAEFDLTPYLKPGQKNLIAFQVFRWCDGSYLEDQDFFRYSGVSRDCYLYVRHAKRIEDLRVTPDLDDRYQDGTLEVRMDVKGKARITLELLDARGETVCMKEVRETGTPSVVMPVKNPHKWTAETPYLYTLRATLKDGKVMRSGTVERIDCQPQQTAMMTLDWGETDGEGEWLLNVRYLQREREGIIPARHVVAKAQIELRPYQAPDMVLKNESVRYIPDVVPQVNDRNLAHLIITGENFRVRFNKMTGYMERYAVNRTEFIRKGGALTPNFWRAPTDNDYGAKLQHKYAAWKNPDLRLTSLKHETKEGQVVVSAEYDMRSVSAKLYLTYTINNRGAVKVNQKMVADKGKKASDMFRFGMQLVMPKDFEYVSYYGRGPVENYSNRNHSTDLGIYHQTVDEQFYPYIRPQETGTKTDIRWWKVLDVKGTGLQFVADAPFSASSLHYTIESLDEGPVKKQGHSQEVEKADLTNVLIDKAQMGLACIDSWGGMPEPEFRLPYEDYEFTFIMTPVSHNYPLY